MFEKKAMMYLYVETPLHVGAGRGTGAVDLPIQREITTGYPMIQASGIKGCLREAFRTKNGVPDDHQSVTDLFGMSGSDGQNYAGAISPSDARLLLLPIRSLAGVFAWTTSVHALANFIRAFRLTGQSTSWELPTGPENAETVLVGSSTKLEIQTDTVVLEEFAFASQKDAIVDDIAEWLGKQAFPTMDDYWKKTLPARLCILPEDVFKDFCLYGTQVQTHVKLNPEKKTVEKGALWTSESLPVDSLLYCSLMATKARSGSATLDAASVLDTFTGMDISYLQIGGDETTGQGWTSIRFSSELSAEV